MFGSACAGVLTRCPSLVAWCSLWGVLQSGWAPEFRSHADNTRFAGFGGARRRDEDFDDVDDPTTRPSSSTRTTSFDLRSAHRHGGRLWNCKGVHGQQT